MVNRSRTSAGACNPLSRSVRWRAPSISAPAGRQGRSPAARLTCARQSARDRATARRRARGPPARRRPKTRPSLRLQPSSRRTGPVVALDEGCAPIACRLVALPSPASRPSTPRRAFSQPRAGLDTARRRPGSSLFVLHRRVDRPPSRHRPARIPRIGAAARSCGPLSPAQTRSVGAQPLVDRPSALGQVRFGPQPGPGRSRSLPLRPAGSRSSCRQPPAPTRQGPPAPPPRPPAQFPAGAGTRAHTYARACGVEIFRKKIRERETARRPRSVPWGRARRGHRFPCQRVCFPEAGWRRGSCGPWLLGHVRRS